MSLAARLGVPRSALALDAELHAPEFAYRLIPLDCERVALHLEPADLAAEFKDHAERAIGEQVLMLAEARAAWKLHVGPLLFAVRPVH